MSVLLLIIGIALLYFGGDLLVRYAVRLAALIKLSPLVIGLTVVAFGTSAPELAATLSASLQGSSAIAFGNIIGSNSANIGLILGLCALVYPLASHARFLKREFPIMLGAALLFLPLMLDGVLTRVDGAILLVALVVYLWVLLRSDETPEVEAEFAENISPPKGSLWLSILGIMAGLVLLVLGARALVSGATTLARAIGISEQVIGLTLVAVGTSLPELASSLIAALKRQGDIALGNIVGSNIFNILGILGISALVKPLALPFAQIQSDWLIMLALTIVLAPFVVSGLRLVRWEGAVLLAAYLAYIIWLYGAGAAV
jgi:cation:H+ antiporter